MQKKVVIGLPGNSSYLPGLRRAFSYLSWESLFFDFRKFSTKERCLLAITGDRGQAVHSLNQRLQDYLKAEKPRLLFVMKGETIRRETLEQAKKIGVTTVNWFPDYVNAFQLALELSPHYDYFFHFDPLAVSQLKKRGRKNVYYLPFAGDILPSDNKPLKLKSQFPISFIGNYDRYREKYLENISSFGLNIWGDKRWSVSALVKNYRGVLPFSQVSYILAKSNIGLNIQHQYLGYGAVLRVFEVMSTGTFLLSEYEKGMKKLFVPGKDMDVFTSRSDLRKKVIYYLEHVPERESIAASGYLVVKKQYTYVHRLREALEIIG